MFFFYFLELTAFIFLCSFNPLLSHFGFFRHIKDSFFMNFHFVMITIYSNTYAHSYKLDGIFIGNGSGFLDKFCDAVLRKPK